MRYLISLKDILYEKLNKLFYSLCQISYIGYKIPYILNQTSNIRVDISYPILDISYNTKYIFCIIKKSCIYQISYIRYTISDILYKIPYTNEISYM